MDRTNGQIAPTVRRMFVNIMVALTPASDELAEATLYQRPVYRAYSRVPAPGEMVDVFDDEDEEGTLWLPVVSVHWENAGPPDLLLEPAQAGGDLTADALLAHGYKPVRDA